MVGNRKPVGNLATPKEAQRLGAGVISRQPGKGARQSQRVAACYADARSIASSYFRKRAARCVNNGTPHGKGLQNDQAKRFRTRAWYNERPALEEQAVALRLAHPTMKTDAIMQP